MKKTFVKFMGVSLIAAILIWGCKKVNEKGPGINPAKPDQVTNTGQRSSNGKLEVREADSAGIIHNLGLSYIRDLQYSQTNPLTAAEINTSLRTYLDGIGYDIEESEFDYTQAVADANDADPITTSNFSTEMFNSSKINTLEKYYLDAAMAQFDVVNGYLDNSLDDDPTFMVDSILFHRIDSLEFVVAADEDLTVAGNDKLLITLSVLKYSFCNWQNVYKTGEARISNTNALISNACKNCVKANRVKLAITDGQAALNSFLSSPNKPWYFYLVYAIIRSLIAAGVMCPCP